MAGGGGGGGGVVVVVVVVVWYRCWWWRHRVCPVPARVSAHPLRNKSCRLPLRRPLRVRATSSAQSSLPSVNLFDACPINAQERKNTEYPLQAQAAGFVHQSRLQMDSNGSATAVSSSVDSAGGSSNMTRSFTAELLNSSHHEAARTLNDPGFLSIEESALLQQRTTTTTPEISSSPAVAVELIDQDADVKRILENCKKDVWKNGGLSRLVEEDYFGNRPKTLHFCTTLDKCLNDVRGLHQVAHQCFEKVDEADKGDGKYAMITTLEELKRNLIFKAAGDLFGEELQSVRNQECSVLVKLERHEQKVDKKLKSIKTWRRVSIITFASAFAAIVIGSVVAAAMSAPQRVAAALAAAAAIPVPLMVKWFDSLWKKYEDALKGEKELISVMIQGTRIAINELTGIRDHVEQLEIQINGILVAADIALRAEESVKIAIGGIKTKLGDFMASIKDLEKKVDRCTRNVTNARTVVLQKIKEYPAKK